MRRKSHSPEQVIAKLRDAEIALSQGATISDVCKKLEVSEQTYHRWRKQFKTLAAKRASDRVTFELPFRTRAPTGPTDAAGPRGPGRPP